MSIRIVGDDGHSLFINNQFVAGGGFGVDLILTRTFSAGLPVLLELAGYNGPGSWVLSIVTRDDKEFLNNVLGLTLNAEGIL